MKISLIAAMAQNRVIGKNNQLPWHMPKDLQHFKALTRGKPVIMGRKTFESIGHPLPKRLNIVISRHADYHAPGCQVVHSLTEALDAASPAEEVMIIGGAEIYQQALARADRMYLTYIHQKIEGDSFFPEWEKGSWHETSRIEHSADQHNCYPFTFVTLERIALKIKT